MLELTKGIPIKRQTLVSYPLYLMLLLRLLLKEFCITGWNFLKNFIKILSIFAETRRDQDQLNYKAHPYS